MSIYLIKNVLKFRVENENIAEKLIQEYKQKYDVTSSSIQRKIKKEEEYYLVKITIDENEEKEPLFIFNTEKM